MSGIYIHLPFCKSKCPYCDFFSVPVSKVPEKEYLNAILKHIEWWESFYDIGKVNAIYFGGGTPSLFSGKFFGKILEKLNFEKNAEISIEANPEGVNKKWVSEINSAGINRIVVGVQSFNEKLLKNIGRKYLFDTAMGAVATCQDANLNVGIDLIFGIPHETSKDLEEDLRFAMTLRPNHISFYALTVESKNNVWKGLELPNEDGILNQFRIGKRMLSRVGWNQYEISNFAQDGFECKHHQNCWGYGEYMGLGAGAVSFVKNVAESNGASLICHPRAKRRISSISGQVDSSQPKADQNDKHHIRFKTTENIDDFINGKFEPFEVDEIDDKMAKEEFIMLALRTSMGISKDKFKKEFNADFEKSFPKVHDLLKDGWLEKNKLGYNLTDKGQEVANEITRRVLEV